MIPWRLARSAACGSPVPVRRPRIAECALAAVVVPVVVLGVIMPTALILPILSLVLVLASGIAAVCAWLTNATWHSDVATAWHVSGVYAFLGFAAGMLCESEQILALYGLPSKTP